MRLLRDIDQIDLKNMRQEYLAGKTVRELAEDYALPFQTIYRIVSNRQWFDPNYFPPRQRRLTDKQLGQIKKLREKGLTNAQISERIYQTAKHYYTPTTIGAALRRLKKGEKQNGKKTK